LQLFGRDSSLVIAALANRQIMAPIPHHFLDCSVYFYSSETAAKDGEGSGGSGFLVHVASEHKGYVHLYAVTNKHVLDEGFHVLRLNTIEGGTETIISERDAWWDHPSRYDVSVLPIELAGDKFKWFSIGTEHFITREIISDYRIGPGDDVFLIGRLITPWGQQRNSPAVRFGNLSMLADPNEPLRGYGEVEQESFLVDCRSLSGFSGSPVIISTTRAYTDDTHIPKALQPKPQPEPAEGEKRGMQVVGIIAVDGTFGPWLLGIDWGHLPLWKPVYRGEERTDYRVEQNTGIACVLPAWHILDLLNEKELSTQRKRDEEELTRKKRAIGIPEIESL
jgi:hypothetical protein